LVSIPVRLYTATQSHDVHFHLLHKKDGVRLQNVRWCPKDEKAVPWDEVVRGFEYAKGNYVPITEEDLEHLPVKTIHTVDISDFVTLEEVDPIYYDKAYYLAPDEAGVKAFVLLRQALEQTGRAAVAKVAIRDKESLCLVLGQGDSDGDLVDREPQQQLRSEALRRRIPGGPEEAHRCQGRRRATAGAAVRKGREDSRLDGGAARQRRGDQEGVIGPSL
jgi:hypothetical protein